ncbi:N-acetylmuramoyl-L-alanine amidase [Bacillus mycoides]|uniref:Autolysin n=1 Tax=Bacillus thuringiensis serovar navarrensis TaxID=339658 RepID=A0A243ANM5_BACTU|nr:MULTISPECIES: N-acetylmuramoyl-L-alanine amidase [Bacillus cereus group]MED1269603.1 N-acetylmuramoyl-L-alanine amidase [Bacillus mycoides]OTY28019.1 N-acetylmuramoyl-L-alanine amidase [Bacillus thuringiensis serovar navarrensis]
MKKKYKHSLSIVIAMTLVVSIETNIFAERVLLIHDLPTQPYRYGVGAYEGVVAHSIATPEAPAINIQKYESRTWRVAFVHYAVDWDEKIQIASTKYQAGGAGPVANARFVHVELCETCDPMKFKRSYEKYVELIGEILRERNIHPSRGLWTHKDVTYKLGGTDHEDPLDYLRSHGVSEAEFRADVLNAYNSDSVTVDAKPQESNNLPSTVEENGVVNIEGYNVNLRSRPSTENNVICKLQKGETYKVGRKVGNWLDLGGNQWIYYDSSYIRYNGTDASSIADKKVISKVNNLRFYESPSWQDKDVAGVVDAGLGFVIDTKFIVNGSYQYKVHNSIGRIYYVTDNQAYVYER